MATVEGFLFLGKAEESSVVRAAEFVKTHVPGAQVFLGRRGEPFPTPHNGTWDYILSYLSPWVIPASVLARARRAAVNFHPGPPEYPGIGCTNFALYDGAATYGVTCHHMAPRVDTGDIIRVSRFSIRPEDTVLTVTQRCYAHIAVLFYEMMDAVLAGRALPRSAESWAREPYTRAEFNTLLRLSRDMAPEEVRRRIRATTYPGYPAAAYADEGPK